jgi:fructose-specific phosphotransferase system IIC component
VRKSRGLKLLATIPITVTPSPPPVIGKIVSTLLTGLILIGWIVVIGAFILGGIYLALGDSEKGRKYISGGIIGAIIMILCTAIVNGLLNF